jgi:hypothetical protein
MSESENKNLVVRLFESLSTGDIDAALELMDNDAVYWVCGKPKQFPLAGTHTKQQLAAVPDTVARATPNAMTASITATTACMRTSCSTPSSFVTKRSIPAGSISTPFTPMRFWRNDDTDYIPP